MGKKSKKPGWLKALKQSLPVPHIPTRSINDREKREKIKKRNLDRDLRDEASTYRNWYKNAKA